MSSIISQPRSGHSRRRRAAAPSPPGQSAHLQRLVGRVADKDKVAFADLYDALSPRLLDEIRSASASPLRVAALVSATFVEVWALARFHTGPGNDVEVWITDIAARRTTDRRRGAQGYTDNTGAAESVASSRRPHWSIAFYERYDRQYVLCLAALLNRPLLALLEP